MAGLTAKTLSLDVSSCGFPAAASVLIVLRRATSADSFSVIPADFKVTIDLLTDVTTKLIASTYGSVYEISLFDQDRKVLSRFFIEMPDADALLSGLVKLTSWPSDGRPITLSELNLRIATEEEARQQHEDDSENPHGVTAEQVGLGSVDNTSDADKPISEQTQAAIDQLRTESEFGDAILNGQVQIERDERLSADSALQQLIDALANGATRAYLTYSELDAAKATLPANSFARVTNDPTPANNWLWQWDGTILTKSARDDLAVSLAAIAVEVVNRTALIKAGDDALVDKYGFVIADFITQGLRLFVPLIAEQLDIKNVTGDVLASFTAAASQLAGMTITKDGNDLAVKDTNGFVIAALDQNGLQLFGQTVDFGGLKVTNDGGQFDIKDGAGFTLASFLSNALAIYLSRIDFGAMSIIDNANSLILQDKSGFNFDLFALLTTLSGANEAEPISNIIDCSKPLFSNKFVAWENDTVTIDTACLLDNRILQRTNQDVVVSVSSQTKPFSFVADGVISIPRFSDIGTSAFLTLRDKRVPNVRSRLFMTCAAVPDTTQSVAVHMIGDSIGNRGGGALLKEYLLAHGYTSTFIGTMRGDSRDGLNGEGGELGECREGWKATDFTYAVTTRIPVAVGDEAAYLAASKGGKAGQCPYLRIATGGDNPAFVKNGYIFDFAFYLSRFSLATPQVVTIGLGTNDVAALANPALATAFYSNMTIMITQIRTAVPSVPIVIYIPSTPHESEREQLWTDKYTVVIRELQKLAKDLDVILAPTWTLTTIENGYAMSVQSTDAVSGAETGGFADRVHPTNTPRYQLYNALSAYVAAAKSNLI